VSTFCFLLGPFKSFWCYLSTALRGVDFRLPDEYYAEYTLEELERKVLKIAKP